MSPELNALLPADKSWFIRVAFLSFLHGKPLPQPPEDANADIKGLLHALAPETWKGKEIPVGDSATAFRFLQFHLWKSGEKKTLIKGPILAPRPLCDDPSIIHLPQKELLKLDKSTSQWASAAALCGDPHRISNPPNKLALSYEALDSPDADAIRPDATILRQAEAFLEVLRTGTTGFLPSHSEDFCFANAFALLSAKDGARRWPSLAATKATDPKKCRPSWKPSSNNA